MTRRKKSGARSPMRTLRQELDAYEYMLISRVMRSATSVEDAAGKLGVPKTTLTYKLRKHRIKAPNPPKRPPKRGR